MAAGNFKHMDENRALRVTDALRDRGIDAHLANLGVDVYGVRVHLRDGRDAMWGTEGTSSLEADVLFDGDLVGFVPEIPGSQDFSEDQIVDAIARADYSEPEGRERDEAATPRFCDIQRIESRRLRFCSNRGHVA